MRELDQLRWVVGATLSILATAPLMAASLKDEAKKSCEFSYTDRVINDVVIPTLSSKLGTNYTLFNTKRPAVIQQGKNVLLSFNQAFPEKGILPIDTGDFDILLDPCTLRVIEAHLTTPYPFSGR